MTIYDYENSCYESSKTEPKQLSCRQLNNKLNLTIKPCKAKGKLPLFSHSYLLQKCIHTSFKDVCLESNIFAIFLSEKGNA